MAISDKWWDAWWEADYSWEGLAKKPWKGWLVDTACVEGEPFVPVPEDERVERVDYREATLQDYWRRAGCADDLYPSPDGDKRFTLMHLPPQWRDGTPTAKIDPENVPAGLEELLKAELGQEIKDTVFEDGWRLKGADHRLQWQGVVLPTFSLSDLSPQTRAKNDRIPVTIIADQAAFSGDANFTRAAFSGNADFSSAAFSGNADFSSAAFSGYADFSSAAFSGYADFSSAAFSGYANFRSAAFSGKADFSSAAFSGDASFTRAAFSGNADFSSAAFSGYASFSGAAFQLDAIFSGQANSLMSDPVEAEIQFSSPETGEGMNGTYKQSEQSGWRAQRSFPRAFFQNATFFGRALFDNRDFHSATVVRTDRSERNTFDGVTFHKDAVFHGSELHRGIPFTKTDFDQALKAKGEDRRYFERLEDAFRTLKQIMEDRRNRMEEARFFRLELLARRGRHRRWWAKLPSYIYEGLSNFGTSMSRPFCWLLGSLVGFALLYAMMGAFFASGFGVDAFGEALNYSLSRVFPFGDWAEVRDCSLIGQMQADGGHYKMCAVDGETAYTYWGPVGLTIRTVAMLQSLFALILVFLFGLAARRRFQIN